MRIVFLYIIGAFLISSCSNDDKPIVVGGEVNSISTIGGSNNDSAQSVIPTSDGGYAILGYTHSLDGDIVGETDTTFDFWMLKYNDSGDIQWQKTFGGSAEDRGADLVQTSDGGYAVLGYSKSSDEDVTQNAGGRDFWVVKLDSSGNILWQKSHGFLGSDYGTSIVATSDNGLLLVGVIDVTASAGAGNDRSSSHAGGDYWAIKLNSNGDKEWRQYYGGNLADTPNDVVETANGDFIIVGGADSDDVDITDNKGTYDFWTIRINATGNLLWRKNYGGSEIDRGYSIIKTSDGNYVLSGDTSSSDQDITNHKGGSDVWLVKINDSGDMIWQKTIGGSTFDASRAACNAQEGGFFVVGSSRSVDGDIAINQGQNDALIIKVSDSGNLEWHKTIGGSNIDFFYGVAQLNNGNVIAVGDSMSSDSDIIENKGFTDALIVEIQ